MLPKYVTLLFVRNRFVAQSGTMVAYECYFAYQLFSWLASNGYVSVGTNLWRKSHAN